MKKFLSLFLVLVLCSISGLGANQYPTGNIIFNPSNLTSHGLYNASNISSAHFYLNNGTELVYVDASLLVTLIDFNSNVSMLGSSITNNLTVERADRQSNDSLLNSSITDNVSMLGTQISNNISGLNNTDKDFNMTFSRIVTTDPYIDVRAFGAKGDGVTDDTSAIQNASNAAYNNRSLPRGTYTPSIVYFPPGVYNISHSIKVFPGVTYLGSGSGKSGTNYYDDPFGGSTILMNVNMDEPAFYGNMFMHHFKILDMRIEGVHNYSNVNAHGIWINYSATEISGMGELATIDNVYIHGVGGNGVMIGGGTESQPLYLGKISVHQNGLDGVHFENENYGFTYVDSVKGDNNRNLIFIDSVSGQSNYFFNNIAGESNGTAGGGHLDQLILINDSSSMNLGINQLDIRIGGSAGLNPNASVIRTTDDVLTQNNAGLNYHINQVVQYNTSLGYRYLYFDDNKAAVAPYQGIELGKTFMTSSNNILMSQGYVVFDQSNWNNPKSGIVFRAVNGNTTQTIGGPNMNVGADNQMNFNNIRDGATKADVAFYDGGTSQIFKITNGSYYKAYVYGGLNVSGNVTAPNIVPPSSVVCSAGFVVMNITLNTSGIYTYCVNASADTYNTTLQMQSAINNSGFLNITTNCDQYAFCPSGSVQIGCNSTGRYCDSTFVNSSDVDQFFNSSESAIFTGLNITGNESYIGSSDNNITFYFYEDSNPRGEYFQWNNNYDRFELSDSFYVDGDITSANGFSLISSGDISSTGTGDDFWLGTSTQSASNASINSSGYAYLNDTVYTKNISVETISFRNSSGSIKNNMYVSSSNIDISGGLYANGNLATGGNLYTYGDLYTASPGSDFHLGSGSFAGSNASINSSGTALFNQSTTTPLVSTSKINLNGTSTYSYSNGSCIFFITGTANETIGC